MRENVAATYDEMNVDEFMEAQKSGLHVLSLDGEADEVVACRVYPQWTGRRDKNGLPLYVFKISDLTKEAINHYNQDPKRLVPRMIALYEASEPKLTLKSETDDEFGIVAHGPIHSPFRQFSPSHTRRPHLSHYDE